MIQRSGISKGTMGMFLRMFFHEMPYAVITATTKTFTVASTASETDLSAKVASWAGVQDGNVIYIPRTKELIFFGESLAAGDNCYRGRESTPAQAIRVGDTAVLMEMHWVKTNAAKTAADTSITVDEGEGNTALYNVTAQNLGWLIRFEEGTGKKEVLFVSGYSVGAGIGTITAMRSKNMREALAIDNDEFLIVCAQNYDNPRLARTVDYSIKGWHQGLTIDTTNIEDAGEAVEISSNEFGLMDVLNNFKDYSITCNLTDQELWAELTIKPENQVAIDNNRGYDPDIEYAESRRKFLVYVDNVNTGYGFECVAMNSSAETASGAAEQSQFELACRAIPDDVFANQKVIKYSGKY